MQKSAIHWRIKDSNNKITPTWDTRILPVSANGSKMEYFSSLLLSIYVRDVSLCWRSIERRTSNLAYRTFDVSNTPLPLKPVFIYKRFQRRQAASNRIPHNLPLKLTPDRQLATVAFRTIDSSQRNPLRCRSNCVEFPFKFIRAAAPRYCIVPRKFQRFKGVDCNIMPQASHKYTRVTRWKTSRHWEIKYLHFIWK